MASQNDLLKCLKQDGCYLENEHFKLVSGKHSDTYIQVRIAMMNPQTRNMFASSMASKLSSLEPTMLAASTIGGILLAIETAHSLNDIPVLIGRSIGGEINWIDAKAYDVDAFSRVALIDDIITTSGTITSAIMSLRREGAKNIDVAVIVDRSGGRASEVTVDGTSYRVASLINLPLNAWDPSECPICPSPYINLHRPEDDVISVILSMPPQKAEMILNGYKTVFQLQHAEDQLNVIKQWRPWIPSLLAGLPKIRVGEDSQLAQFVRLLQREENNDNRKRVLSELVGHLLAVSQIKVESRSLG
ncbi:MAG: hypothetical protein WBL87_08895, partial [Methanothrix sp.]